MQKRLATLLWIGILSLSSCDFDIPKGNNPSPKQQKVNSINTPVQASPVNKVEKGRDTWQRPSVILSKLGNVEGKKIADIGAGFGYFTFLLSGRNAEVLVVEIDQEMIDFISSVVEEQSNPIYKKNISYRFVKPDDPMLNKDEVDHVMLVNMMGYLDDKLSYLKILRKGLKPNAQINIVDFKMKRLPQNLETPRANRVYADITEELLYEAGYTDIVVDDTSLEYQYIITAKSPF